MSLHSSSGGRSAAARSPGRPATRGSAEGVLDAAQALIQQKGYNGFSYEDISQVVGLKKPSIHHYFPRKEDLAASVVRRYTERFESLLARIDEADPGPLPRLEAYLQLFYETYGPRRTLCPCGILGAEADALPALVTDAVNRFFRINIEWLTAVLAEGRSIRQFDYQGGASDMAAALLSALEGAMVVGRGLHDAKTLQQVGTAMLSNIQRPGDNSQ